MKLVKVQPSGIRWSCSVSGVENDMLFHSGAAAEAAARRMAACLAAHGEPTKLVIHLRDGSVAGRFLFPPAAPRQTSEDLSCAA